jgi:hypothetical protein
MPRSRRWADGLRSVAREALIGFPGTLQRARSAIAADRGSASIEFVAAGLILLLPTVYLVLALAAIQAGAFAAEAAARQAARLFVQAQSVEAAQAVADRAIQFALTDYGVERGDASVRIDCVPAACLEPGAIVTVSVTVSVPLPLVPPVLQGDFPLAVSLEGVAAQRVSRFGAG